jgi:ketosteroid isomerase-like protein
MGSLIRRRPSPAIAVGLLAFIPPLAARSYHALVRRRIRRVYANLSKGNYAPLINGVAADVHHLFPGDHPLGGERHSREALERWFERVYRLFPNLSFEVEEVISRGWPGNTVAAVQWVDYATPQDGEPYVNQGTHFVRFRWGRLVYIHADLASQRVAETCRRLADKGVEEAAAAPITA